MGKKKSTLRRSTPRASAPARRPAAAAVAAATIAFAKPTLRPGEEYAGIVIDPKTGALRHLVEIARNEKDLNQAEQIDWAKSVGGQLPSQQEGFVLLANRRHAFKPGWYWTRDDYPGNSVSAYVQTFRLGLQSHALKDDRYMACAVRSEPI